jgi:hypothetical protein
MIKDIFALWRTQSDLMKLQYAYGVVILVLVVTAGLIGLLNEKVSWQILSVTWIVTVAFFVNLISYALVNLFLPPVAPKATRPATKRKR